jgi:hypothetical protein
MPANFSRLRRLPLTIGRGLANAFNPIVWRRRGLLAGGATALLALVIVTLVVGWWWSDPPDTFNPTRETEAIAERHGEEIVTGYTTTATLIHSVDVLLHKPGGYLYNDVMPPGVLLDNVPSWEYGAVIQMRDLARSLRNDMSRSQSQSREDEDLSQAEPRLNFNANSWIFPSTESEYEDALRYLRNYRARLAGGSANFYARADNLRGYLEIVGQRLGGVVQRLSASVGEWRVNTDLANDPAATSAQPPARELREETPWLEIDNEFYFARGTTWALYHFLKAVREDFSSVLADKNAEATMDELIRALEAAQRPIASPVILNGNGFGFFANHSLVMASYVSRANASLIDLRRLLEQG